MSTADPSPRAARPARRDRQARLARAVLLADRGDTAGAMALARQVLVEDPHYAPASALLDRLNKGTLPRVAEASRAEDTTRAGVGAESPVSAPHSSPPPPTMAHAAAAPAARASQPPPPAPSRAGHGSWAQFERRMRVRREATCAAAMRQAMDAGDYATALARARELAEIDPAWNDVRLLLEHDPGSLPTQDASVPAPTRRRFPRLVVVALALFVLTATGGWVVGRFFAPTTTPDAVQIVAPLPAPSAAVEVPGLPPIGTAPPAAEPAASLSVATPSAAAAAPAQPSEQPPAGALSEKEKTIAKDGGGEAPAGGKSRDPRVATTGPPTKPPVPLSQQYMQTPPGGRPEQPFASSSSYPPSPAATAGTSGSNSLASGTSDTASRLPNISVESAAGALQTLPMVASQPEPPPPSPSAATKGDSPSATGTTTPSPSVAPRNTDERRAVAATLAAYQQGYRSLDAAAVQRVWPGVDVQQLRSAFAQLESQRLAFSGCSIDVRGLHASATCSGTATYVPKVGSGEPVNVQRTWQFALQKFGEGWLIDAATAR